MFSSIRKYFRKTPPADNGDHANGTPVAPASSAPADGPLIQEGIAAIGNERFAEAVALYEKAIAVRADNPSSHVGLGFSLSQLREFGRAIPALERAVALNPQSVDGYFMLGRAYLETGDPDAAEVAWRTAHELAPDFEHVYCDYCLLLFSRGKTAAARKLIEKGLAIHPRKSELHFYLGNLLSEGGEFAAALSAYREAMAIDAPPPGLLSSFANALRQTGDLDQSIEVLQKAIALAPDDATIASNHLFSLQYSQKFSRQEKFAAHVAFSDRFETPLLGQWGNYGNDPTPDRKLKVGYVSGDLRSHSLAFFIEPVLQHQDRSRFEIHCYYAHPVHDDVSERIKGLADRWNHIANIADEDLAAKIRADGIDILIDLSGHTGHNRLLVFARKPAPIQMTWLGYQATTGLRAVDFRVTEESLDPLGIAEEVHSEKLLRLPSSGTFSPSPDSPPVNSLPAIDGRPFTFGCLNNPSKITDEVIVLWAEILKRAPAARLMIGNSTPELAERISAQFLGCGIRAERIVFKSKVSLVDYLALHNQIDLALDTFPYNGGTTTFHSLWMGVPIIAMEGDTSLSRVGASIMHGLGRSSFCAANKEQYIERAVHHAEHLEELQQVRLALREQMTMVTRQLSIEVTRSLENALRACWTEFCVKQGSR